MSERCDIIEDRQATLFICIELPKKVIVDIVMKRARELTLNEGIGLPIANILHGIQHHHWPLTIQPNCSDIL